MPDTAALLARHAHPDSLDVQLEQARLVRAAAALRITEVMFLEVRSIFTAHPEVVKVSFDLDGDVNSYPLIECLDASGEDVREELEDVDAIADRWNETNSQPTVDFLERLERFVFTRAHFAQDVQRACLKLSGRVPLDDEDLESWAGSFSSYLAGLALDQALPRPGAVPGRGRM